MRVSQVIVMTGLSCLILFLSHVSCVVVVVVIVLVFDMTVCVILVLVLVQIVLILIVIVLRVVFFRCRSRS